MKGLLIVSLSLAVVAIVCAIWSHTRLKASPTERWLARGIVLGATGGTIGMLANLLFPHASGVGIAASLVSMVFTVGSFVMLRNARRKLSSKAIHDARR